MVLPGRKSARAPLPYARVSRSSLRRPPTSPEAAGKQICPHCLKGFVSVSRHQAQAFKCGLQARLDAISDTQARELQRTLAEGEPLDPNMDWLDEDMEIDGEEYKWENDPGVVQFVEDMGLFDVDELETVPLEESILYSDEEEEAPVDPPPPYNNPPLNNVPLPPCHVPEPSRYEPLGKKKFDPAKRAGAPLPGYPDGENSSSRNLYQDWVADWKAKNQGPIYGPFDNQMDWDFCKWAKENHLKKGVVNSLLKIPGVSCISALSLLKH